MSEIQVRADFEALDAAAKVDLTYLAMLTMPTVFKLQFCDVFNAAWSLLIEAAAKQKDFTNLALGLPRGFGKSAVIKLFCQHSILFSDKQFILLTAANQSKANALLADVRLALGQPNIKAMYGNWEANVDIDRADLLKFTWRGKSMVIQTIGSGGDPRGANINYTRPDLIICDDVQSRENSKSPTEADNLREWLFATLFKTNSKSGCLTVYIGNMYPGDNCILKELKESQDWVSFIAGALLQDGESIWPELVPTADLYAELARDVRANNAHIFFSEVLNDSSTQALTKFSPDALLKYEYGEAELAAAGCIIIDPAGAKATSDDTVILVTEQHQGIPWAKHYIAGKFTPLETINKAIQLALDYNIPCIVVESYAYQASLLFWFKQQATILGIEGITFLPLSRKSVSKNSFITSSFLALQKKELGIHTKLLPDYLSQVYRFNPTTKNNVDDLLDAVAYMQIAYTEYPQQTIKPWLSLENFEIKTLPTYNEMRIA